MLRYSMHNNHRGSEQWKVKFIGIAKLIICDAATVIIENKFLYLTTWPCAVSQMEDVKLVDEDE